LELSQIDVERSIESEGCGDGRYDLSDESVQVGVCWSLDVEVTSADIVDSFVVNHEGTVGVFQCGVGCQDRVVRLNHCSRYLRSWVY